jgi:hypothetical protein
MHRLEYALALASSALMLTLVANQALADLFTPEVFSREQQNPPAAALQTENKRLHNAGTRHETRETERTNRMPQPRGDWISLPVKAHPPDQPTAPGLRF